MSSSHSELDLVIAEVKEQFRLFLIKRKELVLKLGYAYEQAVVDSESICEEIKNVLHDEIVEKLISRRDIERYCFDKWKRKTKPNNDKLSFSMNNDSYGGSRDLTTIAGNGVCRTEQNFQAKAISNSGQKEIRSYKSNITNNVQPNQAELVCELQRSKQEVSDLRELIEEHKVKIKELEEALTKSAFTTADQMSRMMVKDISVDLEKFGAQLFALIRNRKKSCYFQVDESGNAIALIINRQIKA